MGTDAVAILDIINLPLSMGSTAPLQVTVTPLPLDVFDYFC
jgi:hypothetical protein